MATSRRDGTESRGPSNATARRSRPGSSSRGLVRAGDSEVWDLRLVAGDQRLRLGAHFDGVFDKSVVIRYPARSALVGDTARRLRVYYTKQNRLSLRSTPTSPKQAKRTPPSPRLRPDSPGDETPRPGPRRRVELAAMAVAQRTASGLLRLAIGRRRRAAAPPGDARKVYVLLMNAYGMGGTIRTTLNLVEQLAETHDVELITVMRRREHPLFPFPEGITVSARRRPPPRGAGTEPARLGRTGPQARPQPPRASRGLGFRRRRTPGATSCSSASCARSTPAC